MQNPKVVIIDDHAILRRGLNDLFRHNNIDVTGEGGSIAEARTLMLQHPDAIFILDLNLGNDENAFPLIAELKAQGTPVMIYCLRENLDTMLAAYRAGAAAYVPKSADSRIILEAIRKIRESGSYFMPGLAEQLMVHMSAGSSDNPAEILTDSELKIFILAAKGKRAEEIARELSFAVGSVHNRMSAIRRKLNCSNMEFYKLALKHGLVN